jgi:hypothetical protein
MREKEIIDKLDKIIELLEKLDRNTQPVITWPIAPTVWVNDYPQDSGNSGGWRQGDDWTYIPPLNTKKVCHCEHCKGVTTDSAGGCIGCGCRLIAIYTEDGNWWCNKCHRESFYQDGSPKL